MATSARAAAESFNASVKVDTRKLDNLVDMVGELVIVQSIIQKKKPLSHAELGMKVVSVLEASQLSIKNGGTSIKIA